LRAFVRKFCFSKFDMYFRTTLKFRHCHLLLFANIAIFSAADNKVTLHLHFMCFKWEGIAKKTIFSGASEMTGDIYIRMFWTKRQNYRKHNKIRLVRWNGPWKSCKRLWNWFLVVLGNILRKINLRMLEKLVRSKWEGYFAEYSAAVLRLVWYDRRLCKGCTRL
jgi:hypothetical protein